MLGRTIGHYRILEKLGEGGMGVVFKAEDTRLGRQIALKFLPDDLSRDTRAMERLRREAQAASTLNHPHICTLHDIADDAGRPFLVMELLEGQTLRHRLATGKPFDTDQIVEFGIQLADALEAAHAQGVIHRDIKPGNIFITKRGDAKLMDFGLAKLARPRRSEPMGASELETATGTPEEALTSPGAALGTVAYMSPEQARGEELDARTDCFSLGAVLYEMATCRQPFPGPSSAEVFAAILNRAPVPPRELNSAVPEKLEQILDKALEKDREFRYQSAGELRADLRRLKRELESGRSATQPSATAPTVARRGRWGWRTWAVVTAIALAVAVLGVLSLKSRSSRGSPGHESASELSQRQLTWNPSENRVIAAAISPDGKILAYAAAKGVFLQVIATGETQRLPLPEEFRNQVWSIEWFPDGSKLAFSGYQRSIWSVSLLGGSPHKVREQASGLAISPDGSLIAFWRGDKELAVMDANGQNPRKIAIGYGGDEGVGPLAWSPDGQRVLAMKRTFEPPSVALEAIPMAGGPASVIVSVARAGFVCPLWTPDGRILYSVYGDSDASGVSLWEIHVDLTGKSLGKPHLITRVAGARMLEMSLTGDAKRIAAVKVNWQKDVYVGELRSEGRELVNVRRLTLDERDDIPSAWITDGRGVLFTSNRNGNLDVFRQDLDEDAAEPVVSGPGDQLEATFSPDGAWILYGQAAPTNGGDSPQSWSLMRVDASGGSPEVMMPQLTGDVTGDCSKVPGGGCVLSQRSDGHLVFFALDPLTGKKGKELARADSNNRWALSADGRRVAFRKSPDEIRILSLDGHQTTDIPFKGDTSNFEGFSWTSDGKGFFFTELYKLLRVDLQGHATVLLENDRIQSLWTPVPSPDGRHLAFATQTWESNVWLLEGF